MINPGNRAIHFIAGLFSKYTTSPAKETERITHRNAKPVNKNDIKSETLPRQDRLSGNQFFNLVAIEINEL